jgi:hypothetical protein
VTDKSEPGQALEQLLDAAAAQLNTREARKRLLLLGARLRSGQPQPPPELAETMALAMRGMADAFGMLAEHAEALADRADFMTRTRQE